MAVKNLALKYSGEKVSIGGAEYVAAPLPIGKMKLIAAAFDEEKVNESEMFENMIYFIHASIVRNHPDVTTELIEDELTISEASELFRKIIILSGMKDDGSQKKMTK